MEVQSSGYDGNLVSHDLLTTGANNLRAQEQAMSGRCSADHSGYDYSSGGFSEQPGCKTGPSLWKLVPSIAINVF